MVQFGLHCCYLTGKSSPKKTHADGSVWTTPLLLNRYKFTQKDSYRWLSLDYAVVTKQVQDRPKRLMQMVQFGLRCCN